MLYSWLFHSRFLTTGSTWHNIVLPSYFLSPKWQFSNFLLHKDSVPTLCLPKFEPYCQPTVTSWHYKNMTCIVTEFLVMWCQLFTCKYVFSRSPGIEAVSIPMRENCVFWCSASRKVEGAVTSKEGRRQLSCALTWLWGNSRYAGDPIPHFVHVTVPPSLSGEHVLSAWLPAPRCNLKPARHFVYLLIHTPLINRSLPERNLNI